MDWLVQHAMIVAAVVLIGIVARLALRLAEIDATRKLARDSDPDP